MWTISQAADRAGLTCKAVRVYESRGLRGEPAAAETDALTRLDQALVDGTAGGVRIRTRNGEPWITVPKLMALPEPEHLAAVKDEVQRRWGTLDLLDVLKDADFLAEFTLSSPLSPPGRCWTGTRCAGGC